MKYAELNGIKDWRRMLDDSYLVPFTTPDGLRECNYNITNVTSADNTHHIKFTTEFTPRIFNKGIF